MRQDALRELPVDSDSVQSVGLETFEAVKFTHELFPLSYFGPVVTMAADYEAERETLSAIFAEG